MSTETDKLFIIQTLAPVTQYQDEGRIGSLHQGFSRSGPMDTQAFSINNRLLNNPAHATQLEIAPGGLTLKCLADCSISIAGAYLRPTLNKKPLINFCAVTVNAGDELKFGFSAVGQFAYLAIAGGFQPKPFLGSCSTTKRLGIFPSGELAVGSYLLGKPTIRKKLYGEPRCSLPNYTADIIDVFPAFQYRDFSMRNRQQFVQQSFRVGACDRMGARLLGSQPIEWSRGEMLSEGLIPGAVQIPPDGSPIVLQKDAQSIGGYPKIGCLTSSSLNLLAQKKVGEKIRFRWLTP